MDGAGHTRGYSYPGRGAAERLDARQARAGHRRGVQGEAARAGTVADGAGRLRRLRAAREQPPDARPRAHRRQRRCRVLKVDFAFGAEEHAALRRGQGRGRR